MGLCASSNTPAPGDVVVCKVNGSATYGRCKSVLGDGRFVLELTNGREAKVRASAMVEWSEAVDPLGWAAMHSREHYGKVEVEENGERVEALVYKMPAPESRQMEVLYLMKHGADDTQVRLTQNVVRRDRVHPFSGQAQASGTLQVVLSDAHRAARDAPHGREVYGGKELGYVDWDCSDGWRWRYYESGEQRKLRLVADS